ncbi:MAG: Na/Pi cotransporter family protein [Bacteroidales bacterium]|nr:Na/Pi cotransporter family protein [Bacteroidales bacterium]
MDYSILDFANLIGSLCMFLFGMKLMSDGIQKLAGEKMRSILGGMTKNRFFAILTGVFITTIIQSSSATTVMVVSFVNAGLFSISQALGVIMGANIGTTATAWLISLLGFKVSISVISLPIIGIAFPMLFSKKPKYNYAAETFIGFALLFMGLDFLKSSVPDLKSNPEMFEFIQNFTGMGYGSTFIFIGLGTLLTIVLQSSSATMALTLVMCNNGWIGLPEGAAMVLGENIGTTITANLAALMGNIHAKRAALSHTVFNIIGVIWMLFVFRLFLSGVANSMTALGITSPFENPESIPYALSIFHTTFNITNTLLLVWFTNGILAITKFLLKEKKETPDKKQIEYLGTGLMQLPELSLLEAKNQTIKYCDIAKRMFTFVEDLLKEKDDAKKQEIFERIVKYEDITDRIEQEITEFLISVSEKEVSASAKEKIRRLRIITIEVEKIGDTCNKTAISIMNFQKDGVKFSEKQMNKILVMFDLVKEAFDIMFESINTEDKSNIEKAMEIENRINDYRDKIRDSLYEKFEKSGTKFKPGFFANKICTSCEKIGDNLININEVVLMVKVE